MDKADLAPSRRGADLIDAIWAARREERRDLREQIAQLLFHREPLVREEAFSLLMSKWKDGSIRATAIRALNEDPDFGVRSRVAIGLAGITSEETASDDVDLLRRVVLDSGEHSQVRRAAYEALCLIGGRAVPPVNEPFRVDRDADLDWVRNL